MQIRFLVLCSILWLISDPCQAQPQLPDTLEAIPAELPAALEDPPLDSVLVVLSDSLFLPREGKARIIRDGYGVPHIYGGTDADVAFGFGYAQAEDHLIPMLLAYRQAAGRLAEIKGRSAVESDHMALLWRTHAVAGERYGSIPA